MMKCKQCECEFLSIWKEGYPGGAETGATILLWGIGQFVVGVMLAGVAFVFGVPLLYLFGALFMLMGLLKVASIPDNKSLILQHGGNKCPNCGASNELSWYD